MVCNESSTLLFLKIDFVVELQQKLAKLEKLEEQKRRKKEYDNAYRKRYVTVNLLLSLLNSCLLQYRRGVFKKFQKLNL